MNEDQLISVFLESARQAGTKTTPLQGGRGPGDDAAELVPPAGHDLVWSSDDQLERVHFERRWASLSQIGAKAVAVALSDLAAMGATPYGALVSLRLPAACREPELAELGAGVGRRLAQHDCPLLGGNLSGHPSQLGLTVSVLGTVPHQLALRREQGKAGQRLFVSGTLGLARAALTWLQAGGDPADSRWETGLRALLDPEPRIALGLDLGRYAQTRSLPLACMDLSDGLARDLPRLLRASGLSAVVQSASLPLPRLGSDLGVEPCELAWRGGEDYQLLVAGPSELAEKIGGLREIGWLERGEPGVVVLEGELAGRPLLGFDHFDPTA